MDPEQQEIPEDRRNQIIASYLDCEEDQYSKIYSNEFFGYTRVTIEQPTTKDGKMVTNKQGEPKPDSSKRDYERIPLEDDTEEYYDREVKPHLPDSWIDRSKDSVGYEINFTKYFYEYKPLRSLDEITSDIIQLEKESEGLFEKIFND